MPYAVINCSSSGANTIVAAVTGMSIVVTNYTVVVNGDVTLTWKSNTTAISGPMLLGTTNLAPGISCPESDYGLFQTGAGESLILNLSSGVQASGHIRYEVR